MIWLNFLFPVALIAVGALRLRRFPQDRKQTFLYVSIGLSAWGLLSIFMPPLVRAALH